MRRLILQKLTWSPRLHLAIPFAASPRSAPVGSDCVSTLKLMGLQGTRDRWSNCSVDTPRYRCIHLLDHGTVSNICFSVLSALGLDSGWPSPSVKESVGEYHCGQPTSFGETDEQRSGACRLNHAQQTKHMAYFAEKKNLSQYPWCSASKKQPRGVTWVFARCTELQPGHP